MLMIVLMMEFRFIDLFSGIGGIKIAFEDQGFKCVFSNDFDPHVQKTFERNFTHFVFGDISQISCRSIPDFDVLCAGFPCQPFSIAGYREGFNDKSGRGNLFFEIVRILESKQPAAFLLENVKNLKRHDHGRTLEVIYGELQKLGYKVTDSILNTMEYGNLPQNRERIYIVGFLDRESFKSFKFPGKFQLTKKIEDCLEKNTVESKYYYEGKYLYEKLAPFVTSGSVIYQWRRKYVRENKNGVCPTLTANMGTGGHNVPIIKDKKGIRKLTPRECANFQGFPQKFKFPDLADSRLYQQIGNSVSIPVISQIARCMSLSLKT